MSLSQPKPSTRTDLRTSSPSDRNRQASRRSTWSSPRPGRVISTRLRPPARLRFQPDGSASLRLHLKEEAMGRKILIPGAGSGLGEGTAIGLARNGHDVVAAAQTWPQVTALRLKAKALALPTVRVEKLDLLDTYDVARQQVGFRHSRQQRGHWRRRPDRRNPSRSRAPQLRSQRLCAARV